MTMATGVRRGSPEVAQTFQERHSKARLKAL